MNNKGRNLYILKVDSSDPDSTHALSSPLPNLQDAFKPPGKFLLQDIYDTMAAAVILLIRKELAEAERFAKEIKYHTRQ